MAVVKLADIIEPEVYSPYGTVDSLTKTALYQSGIIVNNELLNQKASSGGTTISVPFWLDLGEGEANISSDDEAVLSVSEKITAGVQTATIAYLNKSYSAADLAGEIAGSDPMDRIVSRIEAMWLKQLQSRLIASCQGIVADNVANDGSDMVIDQSTEDEAAAVETNKFNATNFVLAGATMGDMEDSLTAVAVHSTVKSKIKIDNLIEYIPDSEGVVNIPTYLNKIVITDDGMPKVAGSTSGFKYTSYLFGSGMFGFGEGTPDIPLEVDRSASGGNGGGIEKLHTRKTYLLHPFGFKFTETTVAAPTGTATLAELALPANWDRVVARKNVPFAALITNGI